MKFASYKVEGRTTYGSVVEENNTIYLTDIGKENGHDLRYWIENDTMNELRAIAEATKTRHIEKYVDYLPPILSAEKIACIGVNYANRNAEYKDNSELPKYPSLFLRYLDSFTGNNQNLVRPPESDKLDYEGEMAIIIGKGGRFITESESLNHIAGYAC